VPQKRAQRRPAKQRTRVNRPAQPRTPVSTAEQQPAVQVAERPTITPRTPGAIPARRPGPARRTSIPAINYDYLRKDLRQLGVLAASMVVLVILAFIFIH
jgi:hypothetical protein